MCLRLNDEICLYGKVHFVFTFSLRAKNHRFDGKLSLSISFRNFSPNNLIENYRRKADFIVSILSSEL